MPRITSKGQVTIPVELRRALAIEPGAELDFELDGDAIVVRRADRAARARRIVENMKRHPPTAGLTTDEIMAMTRGED